jgi:hypothetical protein
MTAGVHEQGRSSARRLSPVGQEPAGLPAYRLNELGLNAFGEPVEPGRVDCYLGLPLCADEDEDGPGGVLVVAAR